MNIDDVLKFALPPTEDEPEETPGPSKRPRTEAGPSGTGSGSIQPRELTQEQIGKLLEETDAQQFNEVTEAEIKRLISLLEKKYNKNQEMRIKHAEDASKFMESEMELFDAVEQVKAISTRPDLNTFISKQKLVPLLSSLLSHDNLDLVNVVIVFLSELLCIEEEEEIPASMPLIDAFFSNQLIHLLIQTMERYVNLQFEETEQYMVPVLEIFTHFNENNILNPESYENDVKLVIQWILKKIKTPPVYSVSKAICCEILATNIQIHEKSKLIFNQLHGIDTVLRVLAHYKKNDPGSEEEENQMKDLFSVICTSIDGCIENRQSFYDDEGLELMNLIVKERRDPKSQSEVRSQALQVINHCFSVAVEDELLSKFADKYIEMLGLRVLMPVFQKPSSIVPAKVYGSNKRERDENKASIISRVEENSVTILVSLFKHSKPENVLRLLHKFVESEHVKTERLVELYCKYFELFSRQQASGPSTNDEANSTFFILQLVCQLILTVTSPSPVRSEEFTKDIKEKLFRLMRMNPSHRQSFHDTIKVIGKQLALEKSDLEAKQLTEMIEQF